MNMGRTAPAKPTFGPSLVFRIPGTVSTRSASLFGHVWGLCHLLITLRANQRVRGSPGPGDWSRCYASLDGTV